MSWTDERVETLKRMWGEGQSASQIAKELGGVTRNAVIGKVHRLGLSNRVGGKEDEDAAVVDAASQRPDTAPRAEQTRPDQVRPDQMRPDQTRIDPSRPDQSRPDQTKPIEAERTDPPRAEPPRPAAPASNVMPLPIRKAIIPAGQPLPPQPSLNEISPEALASVREVEKRAKRLTLMELTERTCKWPIGDPATDDFWFCGLPSLPGKPYCEAHVGVAFQPMSARRDRRR